MLNIGKFTLKRLGGNLNHYNLLNLLKRNYLSTSQNKNKKSSDKIDLKEEFQEMLNETKISEEEVNKRKRDEDQKTKDAMKQANKDWEVKVENLKKEFEKKRIDEEEDADSELKIKNVKKKIKSAFSTNKSSDEEKGEDKAKNGKNDKNGKSDSSNINTPNTFSKFLTGFAKVWKLTFPGEENLELLLEKRKLEAKNLKSKIKEPTDEEIAEIEASIPEWKRGAVVLVADQPVQETNSFFETAKRNLTSHVKNLKVYQDTQKTLEDSELSLLVNDMKTSYINVKENLKESQNPLFVVSRDLVDRVSFKSPSSQAITVMRKYDPEFELINFEKEVNAIFKQLLTAFLKDDLDTIRLVAGEMALAMLTNEIKTRRERVNYFNNF